MNFLQNEFVVLAIDAMLHMTSVVVLGVIVVLACKILSRGFVDAKLFTGLLVALLLVIVRVTLLNYIGQLLPGASGQILEIFVILGLYLSSLILVYKLVSIPWLGTALSSIVIVFSQVWLSSYIPKLSLQLMPEGQRFAEYAGLANDRTKKLMADAKNYRSQSGGIKQILADALEAIKFFTSDEEQDQLSKDFASGIAVYKARKEYMDNMTPEELASYRKAMSAFLEEQGLAENRYSLSNLKNAKPEDLENLASFMKDMNKVYGFTDELPEDGSAPKGAPPPSTESISKMAQELSKVDMSADDMAKLGSLFSELGIDADSVMAGMAEAREDLANIRDISSKMAGEFKRLVPDKMPGMPSLPEMPSGDDVFVSGGYVIKKVPKKPSYNRSLFADDAALDSSPEMVSDEVAYFIPGAASVVSDPSSETSFEEQPSVDSALPKAVETNYFDLEELNPTTTEQSVVLIPSDADEEALWLKVSSAIQIDAWFAASDESGKSTIFVQGAAMQDGDILEHPHDGQIYRFAFTGIKENLITLVALERVAKE